MSPIDERALPDFDDLPGKPGPPRESTWGLFGDDYELGTLNLLTPERVRDAARLVKTGKRFNLNLPLNVPSHADEAGSQGATTSTGKPYSRRPYRHEIFTIEQQHYGSAREELMHDFNPQGSTQWDGFGHLAHPDHGFYNGVPKESITPGEDSKLSIGKWAQKGGIVGRGVLLDAFRYFQAVGKAFDPRTYSFITAQDLMATAAWEKVEIGAGDILVIRTGYLKSGLEGRGFAARDASAGLGPGREMARFLWDQRVSAVAADNIGVEAYPRPVSAVPSLHMMLLPLLGMPMGELFYLEELAADCDKDGVYEFMLVCVTLNLPGGVGSPANAVAIK